LITINVVKWFNEPTAGGRMDQLNERLLDQTYKIKFIDRKSTTCGK